MRKEIKIGKIFVDECVSWSLSHNFLREKVKGQRLG
jgi:hypothetical protein